MKIINKREFSASNYNKSNLVWMGGDLDENVQKIIKIGKKCKRIQIPFNK